MYPTENLGPYRAAAAQVTAPAHGGGRSRRPMAFFVPPPPEVGAVTSATSTLAEGAAPPTASVRAASLAAGALLGALLVGGAAWMLGALDAVALGLGALGAALGFLPAWYATRFEHRVEYVGDRGVASIVCKGSVDRVTRCDVLVFADAAQLTAQRTAHYYNGAYTGTACVLSWSDAKGRARFTITETVHDLVKPAASFGLAAEIAWTRHLLARTFAGAPEGAAAVECAIPGGALRLDDATMEVRARGVREAWPLASVRWTMEKGSMTLSTGRADAASLPSKGALTVNAGAVGNFRALLVAVEVDVPRAFAEATARGETADAALSRLHPLLVVPQSAPPEPIDRRRRVLVTAAFTSAVVLVGGGFAAHGIAQNRQRFVVVDNPSGDALRVSVDGAPAGVAAPWLRLRVDVTEGAHTLEARSDQGGAERVTVTVPPRENPGSGWYGLWSPVGEATYARVTVCYGCSSRSPEVRVLSPGERFFLHDDADELERLDEPFPRSMSVKAGSTVHLTRLCRVINEHSRCTDAP